MKKAQILSAIALAFALGVVAPVAGVYNASSAYAAETRTKATRAEVESAVAAVEANTTYGKIAAYLDTVAEITEDAKTIGNFDKSDVATAMSELSSALTTGKPAFAKLVTTGINPTDQTIIDAAKQTTYYSIYADIYKAVADESVANLKTALGAYNTAAGKKDSGLTAVEISGLNAEGAKVTDFALTGLTENTWYKNLYDKVETAQKKLNAYNKAIKDLTTELGAILNDKNLLDGVDTIEDLEKLADDDNIDGFTNWENVYKAIGEVEPTDKDSEKNWEKVQKIAGAYKTATNNKTETADQIAETLMGYVIPTDPETPNNPDEPGTEEPGSEDPTAPGTGLVSTAEGNAATTVSIVAGLATALTALGAGVVAYRSARRSNK